MIARVAIALVALTLGCYNPRFSDGQFTCASDGVCPSGLSCLCGVCRVDGSTCADMHGTNGGGNDLALEHGDMAAGSPCSNGGARSPGDPGLAAVAFCPAAWTVAGMTTSAGMATPCNRQPDSDGKMGTTDCSAADNCAPGWHICTGETELAQKGFDAASCSALGGHTGFWATLQSGMPPIPDGGTMPNGPPVCSAGGMPHIIFGCGSWGMAPSSCATLQRCLVSMPGSDGCNTLTSGAFSCPTTMVAFEITVVTKPGLAGGGVICCQD